MNTLHFFVNVKQLLYAHSLPYILIVKKLLYIFYNMLKSQLQEHYMVPSSEIYYPKI